MSSTTAITIDAKEAPRTSNVDYGELLSIAVISLVCNALLSTIVMGFVTDGILYSLANTFEISAIVWIGLYIGLQYLKNSHSRNNTWIERVLVLVLFVFCILPLGPFTWVIISGTAIYLICSAVDAASFRARGGWILLGVTVPMFWSKRLFNLFSEFLLSIDAMLVSSITRTERISNLVVMPGNRGYLQIAAPCSSMANVSLAILCWVVFTQTKNAPWRVANLLWCSLACLFVIAINTTRIALIGFFPERYELIHGPVGSTIVSWITLTVVVCTCYFGVSHATRKSI